MRGKSAKQCFETAALAARMRSDDMGGVVGLDLAGDEAHYNNTQYISCFQHAKQKLGLKTTVHAGEFKGTTAEEVRSAIVEMGADRIGHGYALTSNSSVLALVKERRIHL